MMMMMLMMYVCVYVTVKVIESISLDGSDRRLLLTDVGHAYGVAVVEGVVYWTDWQTESVWRADVTDTAVWKASVTDSTGNSSVSAASVSHQLVVDKLTGLMDLHAGHLSHNRTHSESARFTLMVCSHYTG